VAWADLAIHGGQRVSPADAYLTPARSRPNLTIQAGCLVTGLNVRHDHCTGVSYLRDGMPFRAHTSGEVIVCAGAVGSPQLLLLSGIGPAGQLRALGIDVVADLPAVGENLQDHPAVLAFYASPGPLPRSRYNHGEVYAALRSPLAGAWPDLHLFPILLPAAPAGCRPPPAGYALAAAVVAPDSRGWVRLAVADPQAAPVINPGFLRDQRDTDRLEAGLAMIRQAAASPALTPVRAAEIAPGPGICASPAVRGWIRGVVTSYWHPAGTCRIGAGADPGAVVDTDLRVRGVTGLRVADASVIPVIPNAPLNSTVLAVAERAADLIGSQ
jgi:choline dehydrogenase